MTEMPAEKLAEMLATNAKLDEAHKQAARDALLEHARMGRSVCESRGGQIVSVTPTEIFARYGFDPLGRPVTPDPELPPLPDYILSQLADRAWLDGLQNAGELERYNGEFVIAADRTILAHHADLRDARQEAEQKATERGIPHERLTNYYLSLD